MALCPNPALSTEHPSKNEPQALGQRCLVEPVRICLCTVSCHDLFPGIMKIQLIYLLPQRMGGQGEETPITKEEWKFLMSFRFCRPPLKAD